MNKLRWINRSWWQYLLEKPLNWTKFKCRITCHKCGPIYHNINGTEPDWRCKNCKDYLG